MNNENHQATNNKAALTKATNSSSVSTRSKTAGGHDGSPLMPKSNGASTVLPPEWCRELQKLKADIVESVKGLIKNSEARLLSKFNDLSSEVTQLRQAQKMINVRLTAIESSHEELAVLKQQVRNMRDSLEKSEMEKVSTDLIMHGIPNSINETCADLFSKLCTTINFQKPVVRDIFRVPPRNETNASPIVIRLSTSNERNQLFKAVASYCKANKHTLSLADVGLAGNAKIYLQESLTKANREIMLHATRLKRQGMLSAAFSIRGQVFVRKEKGEEAKRIAHKTEIDSIISSQVVVRNKKTNEVPAKNDVSSAENDIVIS